MNRASKANTQDRFSRFKYQAYPDHLIVPPGGAAVAPPKKQKTEEELLLCANPDCGKPITGYDLLIKRKRHLWC